MCFHFANREGSFLGLQSEFRISPQSAVLILNSSDASDKRATLTPQVRRERPVFLLAWSGRGWESWWCYGRRLSVTSLFQAGGGGRQVMSRAHLER